MARSFHHLAEITRAVATRACVRILTIVCLVAGTGPFGARPALAQEPGPAILDPVEQREMIERVITLLEERYVFPEIAGRLADSLRWDLREGVYAGAAEPTAFADVLSGRIREISRDGHLWIMHDPRPAGATRAEPAPEDPAKRRHRLARSNFGLPRAEVLPGNVGYLDIRQFVSPELGGEAAAAAMTFLAHTDALILDVRQSQGGSARMVGLIASYLFGAEPVHLFDMYLRPAERTEQHWTLAYLPSRRLAGQPVYVLTKGSTFSAGEGLAYVLKHLDRARVVGERTAGGANPGAFHRLGEHFVMFVAEGRVTSPVTGGNWEGTGVVPDVEVPARLALDRAHLLALEHLVASEEDGERARQLKGQIAEARERLLLEGGSER